MNMFQSNKRPEAAAPTAPPDLPPARSERADVVASVARPGAVLSSGVSITGDVTFRNELVIDCEVEGSINSSGTLTIGQNGRVRGEIRTKSVTVRGTVEGNIVASERCILEAGATLRGDVEAPRFAVDENATFLGSARIAVKKQG